MHWNRPLSTRIRPALLALAASMLPFARKIAVAAPTPTPATLAGSLTLIVGGLDERGAPGEDINSDVFMLARVDLDNRTVRAVSIPRDLYVEIPGYGYDKITRAYDYGQKAGGGAFKAGAAVMIDTVSANFGVEIDDVVMTTFVGFQDIVDAVGGVDVNNPYDIYDAQYPTLDYGYKEIYYPAGPLHLSGSEALEFSRTRHQDGDDGRVMRQQLVIRALLERAHDADIANSVPDLLAKHRKSVHTTFNRAEQLALALQAPDFTNDDVAFDTITPYVYPDTAPGGMWIYSGDWSQIPGVVQNFLAS
jgi:LCP family protein required for cell wall assembly